ncbi:hypothetical protein [Aestuariivivens sediminicola]|uniref:hypothetical protein n=1 Tax=Aestuariivivens sediminicola TaxID=2913560 RepID=UPI001F5AD236|nr:hypothetical protein [Aestuariivivens sediminicola]
MSKELPPPQQSEEVDLGQLFKMIGNAFERFFRFIGDILNRLFLAFVWLVFFVKKHLVKIIIAAAIGFGLGIIKNKVSKPVYRSSAIINQNYKTGEVLYEAITYFDKLVQERDTVTLASDLKIDVSKAASIQGMSIEAVTNDNSRIKNYDAYIKSLDSVLASTITYKDYLNFSEEFDISLQEMTIDTYSPASFEDVIVEIIHKIESSPYFQNVQRRDLSELKGRESAIRETLVKSDSLQAVYQEVLRKAAEAKSGGQTSITIDNTENKSVTKEFELYQSDLNLRRELVDIQRELEDKENILEIVSIGKERGVVKDKAEIFGLEIGRPFAYGFLLALVIFMLLLIIEFLNFLERFKSKL